jgi:predicted unusual protein kinase regulating ubiquinone biosynthesis (AarF/ABC1/UbiB family)
MKVIRFFKEFYFIMNLFFIVTSELFFYFIYNDFPYFITRLSHRLASINILYVKIFQAIASNNSLIDEKINNQLLRFTDNAPLNYSDINLSDIIEVTNDFDLVLENGFESPINAGMISLVFMAYKRGTLEPVIIKMKRNNIENKLASAIENLQTFMYLLSFFPLINKYQIAEVVNKNIDIITHQTNFLEEVENMIVMKENCKNLKYVKIPSVRKNVTKKYPNIIIMDYIDGIKINEIEEKDYEGFARQVMKFGFVTTMIHGITHGDLHSGNILFIKDVNDDKYPHKIGVIDFGIIYKLDTNYKGLLFDILSQMLEIPARETAIKLLSSGLIDPPNIIQQIPKRDYENIICLTAEIIEETIKSSKKANQLQVYKFLYKLKEYLGNSQLAAIGIRPSDNFVKSQLILAMSHGVTLTLCKNDFFSLADKVLNELFHTNMLI